MAEGRLRRRPRRPAAFLLAAALSALLAAGALAQLFGLVSPPP